MMEFAPTKKREIALDCILIGCVCILIYFCGLGRMQLKDEEPRRALVAREMLATGSWIVPTIYGQTYLAKPPVFYWSIALFSAPTGHVTETSARLPSAISVVAIAYLVYWMGNTFMNRRAALFSSLIAATTGLFLEKGVLAEIDLNFTLWATGSLFFLFRAYVSKGVSKPDWLLAYLFLALASLTKGPPALIFFCGTMTALLLLDKDRSFLSTKGHLYGLILFLVAVGLWLGAVLHRVGAEPLLRTTQDELVGRVMRRSLLNPVHLLFYPTHVLGSFMPWTPFLVLALAPLRNYPDSSHRKQLMKFSLICAGAGIVLFSLSAGKASRYMLPVFPCLALLAGDVCDRFMDGRLSKGRTRFAHLSLVAIHLLLSVAFVAGGIVSVSQWGTPVPYAVIFASLGVAVSLAGFGYAFKKKHALSLVAIVALVCIYRLAFVTGYVPHSNERKSVEHIIAPISAHVGENGKLYTMSFARHLLFFYLDKPATAVGSPSDLTAKVSSGEKVYCLLNEAEQRELASSQPGSWTQLFAFEYRGEKVALVTNTEPTS